MPLFPVLAACGAPSTVGPPTGPSLTGVAAHGGVVVYSGPAVLEGGEPLLELPGEGCDASAVVAPGDVDGDGVPDLGLAHDRWGAWELRSGARLGDPPFATVDPPPTGDGQVTALGDLDGDGLGDLGFGDREAVGWIRPGAGIEGSVSADDGVPLGGRSPVETRLSAAGDVDGDGLGDVAVAEWTEVDLFPGAGLASGSVGPSVRIAASVGLDDAVGVGDVDADGRGDLLVVPASPVPFALYLVAGAEPPATLEDAPMFRSWEHGADLGPSAAAPLGDLDADGHADFAVAAGSAPGGRRLLVVPGAEAPASGATGAGRFTVARAWVWWVLGCDLDGDGRAELVSDAGIWSGAALLGDPTDPVVPMPWDGHFPVAACVGDVDGDGADDLAVAVQCVELSR